MREGEERDVDITGEVRLAVGVIVRALKDYHAKPPGKPRKNDKKTLDSYKTRLRIWKNNREDANNFLSGVDGALERWCAIIELHQSIIISNYKKISYRSLPDT